MKKILSILLVVSMLIPVASLNSFAATRKATWTLSTSVYNAATDEKTDKSNFTKGGSTVYDSSKTSNVTVKPGQVVWVTVHLKTSSKYYPGELEANVFYSNSIFTSASQNNFVWNTSGSYTSICQNTASVFSKMTAKSQQKNYPSKWSDTTKNANEYYRFVMIPDVTSTAVATVDENLVSFPIYVKSTAKAGSTGTIYISQDDLCTKDNTGGKFSLNYYENGDMSKESVQYATNVTHDTSKAKITYTVADSDSSTSTTTDDKTNTGDNTNTSTLTEITEGFSTVFSAIVSFFELIFNAITSLIKIFTK